MPCLCPCQYSINSVSTLLFSALLEALDVFGEFNPAEFGLGSDEDEDNDERDEVRLHLWKVHIHFVIMYM